jgi:hypothetical protein
MREALPIFPGKVLNSRLVLDDEAGFRRYLASFEGRLTDLTLGLHREKRSNPQNSLYWSCYVVPLANHHGWDDANEMHEFLKRNCNPRTHILNGEEVTVGGSTAKMDRAEFTAYLERIERHPISEGFHFPHEGEVAV